MAFDLPEPTRATIDSVTLRRENHGDEHVPACSIGLTIEAPNTILRRLADGDELLRGLYRADPAPPQLPLDGVDAIALPRLRCAGVDEVALNARLDGWRLHIECATGDDVELSGCKVDKLRIRPREGGTVALLLRIGSSDVDDRVLGRLAMMIDSDVTLRLYAPEPGPEPAPPPEPDSKRRRPARPPEDATEAFLRRQA